jgi:hypothetical protein
MIRLLFLIHRYLGIGMGLLMAVWCLSGVVMMYVDYPDFPEDARLATLMPLQWERCSAFEGAAIPEPAMRITAFQVEMLDGRCVLRLNVAGQAPRLVNLETGDALGEINARRAAKVVSDWATMSGLANETVPDRSW